MSEVKVLCFDILLQVLILNGVKGDSSFDSLRSLRTRILPRMLGFDILLQVLISNELWTHLAEVRIPKQLLC